MDDMRHPYCVIGSTVWNSNRANRTMLPFIEDAAAHAEALLRRDKNAQPGKKLYIVQVVGVVEVPHPETRFRVPNSSDDYDKGDPCG